tara:strand:+ start:429 stop:740 length:312 start_codon:yes stop_codon:yes gene_type:complete
MTKAPAKKPKVSEVHQKVDSKDIREAQKKKLEAIVFDLLGKPKYLSLIRLSNVYSDRWRVDIYCETPIKGQFMPQTKITDSFFIIFRDNEIFSSDPAIEPKYK